MITITFMMILLIISTFRLCILRCLRRDKMELAIQDFIVKYLDDKYIQPPPFDLRACYNDSSVISPLIFVLSSGRCSTVGRVDGVEGWVRRVEGMN